jgi:pyrroloquinoline quinone biosynthesis protein B
MVLGAAAGGGLPQWNCGCANCAAARFGAGEVKPQTQSSVAVSVDGVRWALLNASPDIRQQLLAHSPLYPRGLRDSPLKSVVVTNGDVDHIAGLLVLREKQPFSLFLTAEIRAVLEDNPIFRALDPGYVKVKEVALFSPFELLPDLKAELFTVPGKVPLFMEEGEPETDIEGGQTVGVALRHNLRRIYYIPGCARMTPALAERLEGADAVLFDGTLFTDDEMIRTGTGTKTGRRMGHMPISGSGGSLEAFSGIEVKRKIYVHINNTNPIWRNGPERREVEEKGWQVAHDGMEVLL